MTTTIYSLNYFIFKMEILLSIKDIGIAKEGYELKYKIKTNIYQKKKII